MGHSTDNLFKWDSSLLSEVLVKEKVSGCLISIDNDIVYQFFKNKKMQKKQHKVNSCTKSVTSCLIGIAWDQGYIPDLSTPIVDYFPSLLEDRDQRKQLITIDDLLTMTAGFDWPEMGEWGGWPHMIHSPNWVKYVLERPLVTEPGQTMNYNSGCSQLLLAILQKMTKQRARDYAVNHLFSRLGFNDFIWHEDPQGVNIGGFGLHMTIHDLHKFGILYLNKGKYGKKRLLSEEWITRTTKPEHLTYSAFGHYGRHWWVSEAPNIGTYYFAMGMGGQYCCIVPSLGMNITITSDTYGDTVKPLQIIKNVLLQ
ncbi:serine hydrolase [Paenibacillus kyungheensis]|uniref:Serine hydrolase n=1 Tax=Paenibacillus kyungheensis TaxID=1452732 RepID=A0AAX3M6U0_9BACL|nr:serine hydrolase [Paenibacillus kyungheensis]WCT58040.1 serine hydrolase [Paenibacillus kyungheensis]